MDVFVSASEDNLGANGDTHLKSMDIFVRIASGSIGVQQGDIQYYISCRLKTDINGDGTISGTENSGAESAIDQVVVESDTLTVTDLDGTAIPAGTELTAGTSYKGQITLALSDVDDTGDSQDEIDSADIASAGTPAGCDTMCSPRNNPELEARGRWRRRDPYRALDRLGEAGNFDNVRLARARI